MTENVHAIASSCNPTSVTSNRFLDLDNYSETKITIEQSAFEGLQKMNEIWSGDQRSTCSVDWFSVVMNLCYCYLMIYLIQKIAIFSSVSNKRCGIGTTLRLIGTSKLTVYQSINQYSFDTPTGTPATGKSYYPQDRHHQYS